jgi:hypothetical protein
VDTLPARYLSGGERVISLRGCLLIIIAAVVIGVIIGSTGSAPGK